MTENTKGEIKKEKDESEIADSDQESRIEITSDVAKKLADRLKDPTQGKTMEVELRNKLRQQYHEDICETIDVLTILAHSSEGFHSILAIKKRLESNTQPTF